MKGIKVHYCHMHESFSHWLLFESSVFTRCVERIEIAKCITDVYTRTVYNSFEIWERNVWMASSVLKHWENQQITRLHVQVCSEEATHLGHMLVVGFHAVIIQFDAVFPLAGADGRRRCPVVTDCRRHGLHPGLAAQRCLACANTQRTCY